MVKDGDVVATEDFGQPDRKKIRALVQIVVQVLVTDGSLCVPMSHRLRSEITRWTRGNNSEAGSRYLWSLVTSCTKPWAVAPL
jgi:hypothetical protein